MWLKNHIQCKIETKKTKRRIKKKKNPKKHSDASQHGHVSKWTINTGLHGHRSAALCQCSQKQVTEQSATLHNSISNTDENCDSVSVSQQLLHHLGLKMKGRKQTKNSSCESEINLLLWVTYSVTLDFKKRHPEWGFFPPLYLTIHWSIQVRTKKKNCDNSDIFVL